jgi:hypothetical protein
MVRIGGSIDQLGQLVNAKQETKARSAVEE